MMIIFVILQFFPYVKMGIFFKNGTVTESFNGDNETDFENT